MATQSTALPRVAYTVAEAAQVLGFTNDKIIYEAIRTGKLKAFRPNPKADLRVSAESLREYIKAQEKATSYEFI